MLFIMPDYLILSLSLTAFILSLVSLLLYFLQHLKNKNTSLKKTEAESFQILGQANLEAQQIIGKAEAEELKIIENAQTATEKFEQIAENKFLRTASEAEGLLQKQLQVYNGELNKAYQDYINYLTALKQHLTISQEDSLQLIKQRTNGIFESFEQNLADFLSETEEKTVTSIELELRASRELIDTYKQQQLKVIDENSVAILEKTLSIVLNKKLTLKDHTDLVYEALEKAKMEKFIA